MVSMVILNKIKEAQITALDILDGKEEATHQSIADIQVAQLMLEEEYGDNKPDAAKSIAKTLEKAYTKIKKDVV